MRSANIIDLLKKAQTLAEARADLEAFVRNGITAFTVHEDKKLDPDAVATILPLLDSDSRVIVEKLLGERGKK